MLLMNLIVRYFWNNFPILTLQGLSSVQDMGSNWEFLGLKTSNPEFYPVKSRVPALDIFQAKMKKDLRVRSIE